MMYTTISYATSLCSLTIDVSSSLIVNAIESYLDYLFYLLFVFFFFSSRRRHTRSLCDWSSDVCSSDLMLRFIDRQASRPFFLMGWTTQTHHPYEPTPGVPLLDLQREPVPDQYELDRDRKSVV